MCDLLLVLLLSPAILILFFLKMIVLISARAVETVQTAYLTTGTTQRTGGVFSQ